MSGHHGSRRHQRVRRKSRYAEWVRDAFPSGLQGQYTLHEPTGSTTFAEQSGAGKSDLDINGGVALQQGSIVGGLSGAAELDGATGWGDYSGSASDWNFFHYTGTFTVAHWANFDVDGGDRVGTLVATNRNGAATNAGLYLCRESRDAVGVDNAARAILADGDGSSADATSATDALPAGNDHLVWATGDGSSIYVGVDDMQLASASIPFTPSSSLATADSALMVGSTVGGSRFVDATLQHVMMWDQQLTTSELDTLYKQGAEFFDRGRLL